MSPCDAGGDGLCPASGLQPYFEDVGNCLSHVTVKNLIFLAFLTVLKRIALQHGPAGRTMSVLNTLHQILRSYPEALAEQTSPSWDTF